MRPHSKWLLSAVPLLWACSTQPVPVNLNARVGAPRTSAAAAQLQQGLAVATGIDVTRVRLLVRELELEREGDDSDDGTDGVASGSDDVEVEAGPFVIDVSGAQLGGGILSLPGFEIDPGIYDEVEIEIAPFEDEDTTTDAALAQMQQKAASVIIEGTVDGQSFSFESGLSTEQEHEARFDLNEGGASGVTINLDPRGWFLDASGNRLDPRDTVNKSLIESNIRSSIDAFDDEDEDGGQGSDESPDSEG